MRSKAERLPREANDFYKTPPHCTRALLAVETFPGAVWEPACGDGAISRVLESAGHEVVSSDLIDRGYGHTGRNFLAETRLAAWFIVTNPPYRFADEFVLHALTLGAEKVAMLLRLAWLEGERRRRKVFADRPPQRVWVFSGRPTLWNGADPNARSTGGAISYAWFVWDAAVIDKRATKLDWLPANAGRTAA